MAEHLHGKEGVPGSNPGGGSRLLWETYRRFLPARITGRGPSVLCRGVWFGGARVRIPEEAQSPALGRAVASRRYASAFGLASSTPYSREGVSSGQPWSLLTREARILATGDWRPRAEENEAAGGGLNSARYAAA